MKTIKDSVHDHIEVEGAALDLLDTPPVQRLRRIKQLGTVELVYPSANHTRFEHSLGVYHLATEVLDQLGIAGRNADHVRAAALLHDIGHTPYSHNLESLFERRTGRSHDDVEELLADGPIAETVDRHDLDPNRVAGLVRGEGRLGQLVSGELDVDRMDYLVRDAHHTGVPYGTIDHGRLIRELTFVGDELALGEGNVQTAESLLLARALMNPTVYNHHVARISKTMLRRATERLLDSDFLEAVDLRRMDDADLLVSLRRSDETAPMARKLGNRDLYKRAIWTEMAEVDDEIIDAEHDRLQDWESAIADRAGVEPANVIIDIPPRPTMRESTTRVVVNGDVRRLDDQSALVEALRAAQQQQWRFGVYSPGDLTEPVAHAAATELGLDVDGGYVTERQGQFVPLDEFERA